MRFVFILGLFFVLLACSGCGPDEFDQCLSAISFRDYEAPNLTASLASIKESPSSYVAAKGVSMLGMYYLVIANYEDRSVATMYRTGIGTRSLSLPLQQGRGLYDLAAYAISETPKFLTKGPFDRHSCNFVRVRNGHEKTDSIYVNPRHDKSGNQLEKLFFNFGALLDAAYGEITFDSFSDIPIPPEYTEKELNELYRKTSRNVFGELDDVWLHAEE